MIYKNRCDQRFRIPIKWFTRKSSELSQLLWNHFYCTLCARVKNLYTRINVDKVAESKGKKEKNYFGNNSQVRHCVLQLWTTFYTQTISLHLSALLLIMRLNQTLNAHASLQIHLSHLTHHKCNGLHFIIILQTVNCVQYTRTCILFSKTKIAFKVK